MRIALRTSGGRGEYELAGTQGHVSVQDLMEHEIVLEPIPGVRIRTGNVPRHAQGKPRIRLLQQGQFKHLYLTLSNILLLPKPKREIGITSEGQVNLVDDDFSITTIQIDIVRVEQESVVIRPTNLVLSNRSNSAMSIDVIERMRTILDLWSLAKTKADLMSLPLIQHEQALYQGDIRDLSTRAEAIRKLKPDHGDPLEYILDHYGISSSIDFPTGVDQNQVDTVVREVDEIDLEEARIERVKEWRRQAQRGQQARRFRNDVTTAYKFTCLFSGYYLPRTRYTGSAGVDAAHILPWASYELDSVSNGLCLNKLCHWAFDSGILRLDYDHSAICYVVSIPKRILQLESQNSLDLSAFHALTGRIPDSRLPEERSLWPNPAYLERFYQEAMIGY